MINTDGPSNSYGQFPQHETDESVQKGEMEKNSYNFFSYEDAALQVFDRLAVGDPLMDQAPKGLENVSLVSDQFVALAASFKKMWRAQHKVLTREKDSICIKNFQTAEEAAQAIIDKQLAVANFSDFADLTNEMLEKLFAACPGIDHLIIDSDEITSLPEACSRLKTLTISNCKNLRSVPHEMNELRYLECNNCPALASLPKYLPKLLRLSCLRSGLTYIPDMPSLTYLRCGNCPNLTGFLNDLPSLTYLDCHLCPQLSSISNHLPELTYLDCEICPRLTLMPNAPKLTKINSYQSGLESTK